MIDLKFGDPVAIRSLIHQVYPITAWQLGYRQDDSQAEENIVRWVRNYYQEKFGISYKHILLTHGATGALDIILGIRGVSDKLMFGDMAFGWYSRLAEKHGFLQLKFSSEMPQTVATDERTILITDSPNNPWGKNIGNFATGFPFTIWDSVYASNIFTDTKKILPPDHDCMVGSFSKMFGMSGLRIGWIGTNQDFHANTFTKEIETSYCGLSAASLDIADQMIKSINMEWFTNSAKGKLDNNRSEFSKLSNIFSMAPLENGMFYMGRLDRKNAKLLSKAEVVGLPLTDINGAKWIRFNMSDMERKTADAVKEILKADFIKTRSKK
jgi:aspartate/methionine/tyrosine aminotransferase